MKLELNNLCNRTQETKTQHSEEIDEDYQRIKKVLHMQPFITTRKYFFYEDEKKV